MTIFDEITTADLVAAVRAAAAESPDRVYGADTDGVAGSCVYFSLDGCPSCLIGQGLARLGVTLDDVGEYNQSTEILTLAEELFRSDLMDARNLDWLSMAQQVQDQGETPWGDCVTAADEHVAAESARGLY